MSSLINPKGQKPTRNELLDNYERLKQRLGFVPWNPDESLITESDYTYFIDELYDWKEDLNFPYESDTIEISNQIIRNIMK